MGDVFKEQLVKKKASTVDHAKQAGIVALGIVVTIAGFMFIPSIAIFIMFGASFGAYYWMSLLNKEYEYIFTNGELDIDCIMNRSKRKRMFSGYVKDFEIMAHVDDVDHRNDFSAATVILDFSSGVTNENTYAALVNYKQKQTKIIFEPDEKITKAIQTVLSPRKFIQKR